MPPPPLLLLSVVVLYADHTVRHRDWDIVAERERKGERARRRKKKKWRSSLLRPKKRRTKTMAEKGADAKNGPRLRPIASIDALLSWEPGSRPDDVFCRASVPLRVEEGAEDVRHCFLKEFGILRD